MALCDIGSLHAYVREVLRNIFQCPDLQELHAAGEGDTLLYGYSYLLAWTSFLISLAAALTFLAASRKRNLLNSDNVLFRHQKLDISVPTK